MKKLTLAISAIAAAFGAASAQADVSVSGSGSAAYLNDAASNAKLNVGQFVSFSMSTTTASGMTISGGMGLSNTITADAAQAVTGGQTLTFATGGATITVGDVTGNDTPGSVGGVVGGNAGESTVNGLDTNVATGFADDDGLGVAFSTAVGSSTLSFTYVANDDKNTLGAINAASSNAMMAAGITVPMGAYSVSVGVADSDTGESASGASVSAAIGGGTLTVGYSQQTLVESLDDVTATYKLNTAASSATAIADATVSDGDLAADGDSTVIGATYVMALDADTTISLGVQNAKDADSDSTSQFDASVSRSLGGGASVFLDIRSLNGDAATDGSAVAVGTSVSF